MTPASRSREAAETEMNRRPAVAGQFYAADPEILRRDLVALTEGPPPPAGPRGIALVVPHAGYIYSGRVAGATYRSVRLPRRAVILCPNHTGVGEAIAVNDERVVGTSSVLCVGNTLLINGTVHSPPYRVSAIGASSVRFDVT